jgi:2-oxoglutarate ferredoxin oxidoreductase subunit gamma
LKTNWRVEVIFAGSGGQGVVFSAVVLGAASTVHEGKYAVQTQGYSAQARGGSSWSSVIISDEEIGFPEVESCDILVAMNQRGFDEHSKKLRGSGALLVDEDLVNTEHSKINWKTYRIPATRLSEQLFKNRIYANMIMLGALTRLGKVVGEEAMKKAVDDNSPKFAKVTNTDALLRGFLIAEKIRSDS